MKNLLVDCAHNMHETIELKFICPSFESVFVVIKIRFNKVPDFIFQFKKVGTLLDIKHENCNSDFKIRLIQVGYWTEEPGKPEIF